MARLTAEPGRAFALMRTVSLGIACLVAVLIFVTTTDVRRSRSLPFSIWKMTSGKMHGGRFFDVNGVSLYYETYGAGPPTLVLHGGLGSIASMSQQIKALSESHFVIAVDSRGHGRSTDSDAPLSYRQMSDDASKLLNDLKISRVDIVGWSDGGIIGLDLAIHHPNLVRRLVAISANYDVAGLPDNFLSSEPPPVSLRDRLFARDSARRSALYEKVVTMWRTQPHYTLDDLALIKAPTMIMAGEFDLIKREHTDRMARAVAASKEVIIEGASHNVPNEKPELVNADILRFLDNAD
jgi:pimeloyl-ACP methyl ester carboxylesterase